MHQPPLNVRPFGQAVDLDLDFNDENRPELVTRLLAQCAEHGDPAFWWSQPVSARTSALLRLVAATERAEAFSFTARCAHLACGETFEFELPLQALVASADDATPIRVLLDGQRSVTLRRPTGGDLRQWRAARPASRAEAVRMMLDTLLPDGQVQPQDEARLAESIAVADPLVAFAVSCSCPACGAMNEVPVDLDATALARLGAHQQALLRAVHGLASHYGWSESQVLAIPPARRAQYLAFIEQQS
ncbi:hypothetical protein SAMN05660489_02919 [Pseudomonas sp. LAMO17WK12:I10]|uniref:hypothetical protein n=1 Tax=unclassified Pseudomonas TaxID=196821 RepID=UPI000BD1C6AF|nr:MULTISPECIES: hypothetical protein [unclassified Pseudomonas]PXX69519.1 hypothetical protein H160_03004 [Pseudomonas sp. LAMO17WK12:I9]SNY33000.1 hypothetical protein SAMN05660489_02919 [Pseudomonas sp. LAMO17WK12:I10]